MTDQPHSSPDPAGGAPQSASGEWVRPIDVSRRRLVRGGLGTSVVLSSLVSRPVLGAEYICTLSGFTSGNMSSRTTDVNCAVGLPPSHWADPTTSWPTGFEKGALPNSSCEFLDATGAETTKGTTFNGFPEGGSPVLAATFFSVPKTNGTVKCQIKNNGTTASSMLEVLNNADGSGKYDELGRQTIAALLNAAIPSSTYPLSQIQIITIFNDVRADGVYHVDGANMDLTVSGVAGYFKLLNGG